MLVDSHCHLNLIDYNALESDMDSVVKAAADNGVEHILCVGTHIESSKAAVAIAERYPIVSASIGLHPNESIEKELTVEEWATWASHPKIKAIGETGLDYYRSEGDLTWQQDRFRTHIRAAKEVKKPLIIHTRQARMDTMTILLEEKARDVGGVLHCFTEDLEMAEKALDIGFYISFSGIVTFKNAVDLQNVAKKVPLDRILIETDSPFLAPVPYRGKINQPAYVKHVAIFLADLLNIPFETLAKQTTENYNRLFQRSS